jgi:plasmid stabilization system protein ParE
LRYRIRIAASAVADIDAAADHIAQFSDVAAERWYRGVYERIASLANFPRRFAWAPEAERFGMELRHLIHGRRRNAYRVIFAVLEPNIVRVLYVRHGRRDVVRPPK